MRVLPPTLGPLVDTMSIVPVVGIVNDVSGATRGADNLWHGRSGETRYVVDLHSPEGVTRQYNCSNFFPKPPNGEPIIAHSVGLPVLGTRVNDVVYWHFVEVWDVGDC